MKWRSVLKRRCHRIEAENQLLKNTQEPRAPRITLNQNFSKLCQKRNGILKRSVPEVRRRRAPPLFWSRRRLLRLIGNSLSSRRSLVSKPTATSNSRKVPLRLGTACLTLTWKLHFWTQFYPLLHPSTPRLNVTKRRILGLFGSR